MNLTFKNLKEFEDSDFGPLADSTSALTIAKLFVESPIPEVIEEAIRKKPYNYLIYMGSREGDIKRDSRWERSVMELPKDGELKRSCIWNYIERTTGRLEVFEEEIFRYPYLSSHYYRSRKGDLPEEIEYVLTQVICSDVYLLTAYIYKSNEGFSFFEEILMNTPKYVEALSLKDKRRLLDYFRNCPRRNLAYESLLLKDYKLLLSAESLRGFYGKVFNYYNQIEVETAENLDLLRKAILDWYPYALSFYIKNSSVFTKNPSGSNTTTKQSIAEVDYRLSDVLNNCKHFDRVPMYLFKAKSSTVRQVVGKLIYELTPKLVNTERVSPDLIHLALVKRFNSCKIGGTHRWRELEVGLTKNKPLRETYLTYLRNTD